MFNVATEAQRRAAAQAETFQTLGACNSLALPTPPIVVDLMAD